MGDPHRLRSVRHRPALLADAIDQQAAAVNSETSVSVGHENLRTVRDFDNPHLTRRFSSPSTPRVTNLVAEYI